MKITAFFHIVPCSLIEVRTFETSALIFVRNAVRNWNLTEKVRLYQTIDDNKKFSTYRRVNWLNGEKANVSRTISALVFRV
jgi:hypothetical protein